MDNLKNITVYCSSSNAIAPVYFEAARELGYLMAEKGLTLVYGGGRVGLMGAISNEIHKNGGKVLGVIPHFLEKLEVSNHEAGELIITKGMRDRKAIMEEHADGFITMPGGFGTLEEIFEILTGKQLGIHEKPVVLLNINGYYDALLQMLKTGVEQHFIKPGHLALLYVATTPQEALDYIINYTPEVLEVKVTQEELKKSLEEQSATGEVAGEE